MYNSISRTLDPLTPRTKVLLLTGDKNPRWSISGTVVQCLPFRKYKIKLDGSGRIVVRNRKFLRGYTQISRSSKVATTMPAARQASYEKKKEPLMVKRLLRFNNPLLA